MIESRTFSRRLFIAANYTLMTALGLLCILPFIHVWALSASSAGAVSAGYVTFWPVQFNSDAYRLILNDPKFIRAFGVSLERLLLGTILGLTMTLFTAYPLSKESGSFRSRTVYVWYFVVTMLIGGGLVPTYMAVRNYGLLDSIWALVLPGAVSVFHVVLLLNFFRGLPKPLEESAFIDGAGHLTILLRIYLPLSLPAMATIALFTMVGHWNAWFDGLLYMNRTDNYPLQTYLQSLIAQPNILQITNLSEFLDVTERTVRAAQIFVGTLPILIVYPFLQRFFMKGIVLGSVKG
ncbi:carbohydrate ABC transporter permease [Paenibacillus contaminans]|uniref:Carbohydrate ABC transporter permease n=1 Tax=Paenibacillus contaminans TaxID=450362 RepID=A0A329MN70_9BACL|nr:carbohydrate ABC transporter permease [Paenibacillus contaminans]RAV21401.1 carbohydrate ABC transporter permease [Paenibacillus contaminans]